jgi:pyrimidine-nucleoside phosphorylase
MNQPLGFAVGNALEVREAIQTLRGGGPADFLSHCLTVAGHMLALGGMAEGPQAGTALAKEAIQNGWAWERFKELVKAQGGDVSYVENPERLPSAPIIEDVPAPQTGYIKEIDARQVGEASVDLGAGRLKKGDPIDRGVGIEILHKVGDYVEAGSALFRVHANDRNTLDAARQALLDAHTWSEEAVEPLPLFYGIVGSDRVEMV